MDYKYLLYIDILGFSNLVKEKPSEIEKLYEILNSLVVHKHDAFKTIVFSDTILVYNKYEPFDKEDHNTIVMYSCEFVQELTYYLADKNIYFRAILTYGEFKHYNLKNVECFYGSSLIDAYTKEKEINAMGLFIDKRINLHNRIFPTTEYDKELEFVFVLQSLQWLNDFAEGELPLPESYMITLENGDYWAIKYELKLLSNIYTNSIKDPDVKVRSKSLQTYQLYKNRYKKILTTFEFKGFVPEVIHSTFDWSTYRNSYDEE